MNMVMNNDGSGNIMQTNTLLPPHEWTVAFKEEFAKALAIDITTIRNHNDLALFDVIVTNPPFGSKIPIKGEDILCQYELARIWKHNKENDTWEMTHKYQSSVPPEILFLERCIQLLKPGGRIGIVLPDSVLGAPGLGYIRVWLIQNTRIIASIDLHADTFQPGNGTQTSVLFLQKKTKEELTEELKSGFMNDYNIFMAIIEKIGHDKRGNIVYKRDKDGNEILVEEIDFHEQDRRKKKIIDDQTVIVPRYFRKWKIEEGIKW
jgi:type I restriction enzyme M protein